MAWVWFGLADWFDWACRVCFPSLKELDGEGGFAGHRTLVALTRQAGGHLGDEEDGHGHPGLGEAGADQVQEAILAGEVNGVVLLPHDEVAVQVIASVLQHRALW